MHEFLNAIADAYIADPDLKSYTFVFPNMRSMRYFGEYVASRLNVKADTLRSLFLTMPELVEKGCSMTIAPNDRLLFILYRAYCNVSNGNGAIDSFDRFRYWGQMLLKDFNDVDRYLADPTQLFRNAKDYKQIQSFYLTPQQEQIIRTFWGNDPYWKSALKHRDEATELPFWNHVSGNGEPERKFTQLWAILGELYAEFHRLLAETNECYPGMAYRSVAMQLMLGNRLPFNPKAFVFIGFSRLSHSEHAIFNQLNRNGLAHFYWDYDSALMNHRDANTAAKFIKTYTEEFRTCRPDVKIPAPLVSHTVNIIGVPSDIAQSKVAASLLNDNDTALVLADSELLVPMVASIPEKYEQVNVTMGYPMRFTSLSQLFTIITTMQLRARIDNSGMPTFFHDDVNAMLNHPAVQRVFPERCAALIEHMRRHHLYNLPLSELTDKFKELRPLFQNIAKEAAPRQIADSLTAMVNYMDSCGIISGIDSLCRETVIDTIGHITSYAEEFGIQADRRTFFEMIERHIQDRALALEGESFDAMQVMGVLETRSLAFPNVVMLSMNDETFPGSDNSYSFIPESLRRAYGLPTRDHQEADSAYHFYRILSHAKKLTLIYDARCGNLRTGQPSRYITQLSYGNFPGVKINHLTAEFPPPETDREPIIGFDHELHKDIFADTLAKYTDPAHLATHRISASDLKEYLNCPLEFFLKKINDINPPEEQKEETGAADHGNVAHEVAERIYSFFKQRGRAVTREDLDSLIDGGFDHLLDRELTRAVNIHFLHYPPKVDGKENSALDKIPLDEKNAMYADVIRLILVAMFRKEQTPFTILGTEVPVEFSWPVAPGLTVNFKMIIDRLDSIVEGNTTIHRIIDYKTGNDLTKCPSVESLFEIGNPNQRKAIFQLLVYCAAYLHQNPDLRPDQIRPMIFRLKDVKDTNFEPLTMGSAKLTDYGLVKSEFDTGLQQMFADIFNLEKLVVRTPDSKCCEYCSFRIMCN
ncbi:MAG: PD-(D/E)XK nuclease family protein [Bacteroides sp.]|nr:PD-(D/E)XK nuclease family protein [Bacteroides sp.]MCM1378928.1 PD-(D/E)XK nuclease family protein [Bacteroides sp.]MCM1445544.1 PD-(D/E)XK nuclease family protein [Prevotella sp.]